MTGIILNNNEYTVNTGSTKIEYASTGNSIGFSMYGDDVPFTEIWKTLTARELSKMPYTQNSSEQSWGWCKNFIANANSSYINNDFNIAFCELTYTLPKPIRINNVAVSIYAHPYGTASNIAFFADGSKFFEADGGSGKYKESTYNTPIIATNTFGITTRAYYTSAKGGITTLDMEIQA